MIYGADDWFTNPRHSAMMSARLPRPAQHSLATLSPHTPAAYQINKYTQRGVTHTQTPDSPSPTAINPHRASSATAVRRGSMTARFPSLSIKVFVVCDIDKRARLPTQPQTNQPYTACQARLDNSGLKGCA